MKNFELKLIVAKNKQNIIGTSKGEIPWHCPEDIKRFKKRTLNSVVVMGRSTYFSIPENFRPLTKRYNIVLTRSFSLKNNNVRSLSSINELFDFLGNFDFDNAGLKKEVWVIGGETIYKQLIDYCDMLDITNMPYVFSDNKSYVKFPKIEKDVWKLSTAFPLVLKPEVKVEIYEKK